MVRRYLKFKHLIPLSARFRNMVPERPLFKVVCHNYQLVLNKHRFRSWNPFVFFPFLPFVDHVLSYLQPCIVLKAILPVRYSEVTICGRYNYWTWHIFATTFFPLILTGCNLALKITNGDIFCGFYLAGCKGELLVEIITIISIHIAGN